MNNKKVCIIDRFEGDWAIIEMGKKTFNFPKSLLPEECSEGDILNFSISINQDETEERRKMINKLSQKLFK